MPTDIKAKINNDNILFIKEVEQELRSELKVTRFQRGYLLKQPMEYVREKLDGRAISVLSESEKEGLKANLVKAAKDQTPNQKLEFMLKNEQGTSDKLLAAEKLVNAHGSNNQARHNLYKVCKNMKLEHMSKLDLELHSLDAHPKAKSMLMSLENGVECMRNIGSAKAPQFLGAITNSFEKGKVSIKTVSLLTEATMNARSDDAVHARVSLLQKECRGIFGGWKQKKIDEMSKAFDQKPQVGWEDKISKMTKKERAEAVARLIGTYPELCDTVMQANGGKISNRKLLNAVADIQEQAVIRYQEQGSNKHGKSNEALRPEIMAQIEAQLVTDPKAKEVVKKVLEVNDFAKLGDHGRVDPKAAINVVLVANYPHLCSGLGGKDGVNFKANTPHDNSVPKQLADMKLQGEQRMTNEQKDAGLKPLRMYEEEMKLAKDEPQRVAVLDPHNNNKFDKAVADNSKDASEARSAERGAARVSQLEKLVERSSRESARQSGGRH